MSKLSCLFVLLSCCCLLAWAEPRLQQQQQQQLKLKQFNQMSSITNQQHPYLFLTIPRGRANAGAVVQGFEIVEEPEINDDDDNNDDDNDIDDQLDMAHNDDADDDDDDDDVANNDDDDDNDDDQVLHRQRKYARHGQLVFLNSNPANDNDDDIDEPIVPSLRKAQIKSPGKVTQAKPTQMVVPRDQAGAIMVPDGIIEIEGQSVVDEKTGKAALLVPRAALDAIPDGAVVALMERSALVDPNNGEREEERANRVIVRRRKTGGRRNVRLRRRGGNGGNRRRRVNGNRRRRNGNGSNRRRNVRVVRPGGGRGGGQRRRNGNQLVLQG